MTIIMEESASIREKMSGAFENLQVVQSPAHRQEHRKSTSAANQVPPLP